MPWAAPNVLSAGIVSQPAFGGRGGCGHAHHARHIASEGQPTRVAGDDVACLPGSNADPARRPGNYRRHPHHHGDWRTAAPVPSPAHRTSTHRRKRRKPMISRMAWRLGSKRPMPHTKTSRDTTARLRPNSGGSSWSFPAARLCRKPRLCSGECIRPPHDRCWALRTPIFRCIQCGKKTRCDNQNEEN